MPKIPELLLPAGSLEKMRTAFAFGADAVYAGQPRYSLRARNNQFGLEQIAIGINEAHNLGKKFFVTSNLIAHNDKIRTYLRDIAEIMACKPDALIMADPGLIMLLKEQYPDACIHLSVQANTTNYQSVKFWHKIGISRIILSRELSLDEIERIRQECSEIELEVFVHGALCIAYSGRCLLSGYFNHRDANQGTCTNACRWNYKTYTSAGEPVKLVDFDFTKEQQKNVQNQTRHPLADNVYLIEEPNRPGDLMPIMEDDHGTYIMNSKDLRAVEHVERLVKIGIDSLKIEGRTKSLYYVARTAQTYRIAIDDAVMGHRFNPNLLRNLESLANRGYTSGLLQRHNPQEYQNYLTGNSIVTSSRFVGQVLSWQNGFAEIETKNHFAVGDELEIIHPNGNQNFILEQMFNLNDEPINVASGSPLVVKIPIKQDINGALIAKLLVN